ncbi:archease [Methanonatronarchaeum sp. AMET6-2]|uniref:archease n=1 Tax=Methanonatronarchaeum sp. AMET6-2 TaxID=2933293 RepID=UPI0012299D4D|nr:archease [Methanonatronarchaeum sp. AMET6-2]RZN60541.1 MAG: archease [Methanonatronarchaeia archaeon]UOY10469.1 archease [Methanonatronarchaeum sp. AMET6-2]
MEKFKFLEHTADAQFIAYGNSTSEAFENVGLATFSVMMDTKQVEVGEKRELTLKAEEMDELVYEWLSELIFLFSAENMVFCEFNVEIQDIDNGYQLNGVIGGEKIDLEKHQIHTEVKAPTYHGLTVETNDRVEIKVLLDT